MIISGKSSAYESENQLKIERLLCKIERLEQQLELAQCGNRRSLAIHKANSAKSALSADE
ncbi:MAG: hypothetical protein ACI8SJ_001280, partial [Shewanella sp.]